MKFAAYRDNPKGYDKMLEEFQEYDGLNHSYKKNCGYPLLQNANLSPQELELNRRMEAYRESLRKNSGVGEHYPASVPFYKIKSGIEETNLFKVFRKMPKGGLLHVHSAAALSFDRFEDLLWRWSADKYIYDPTKPNPKYMFVLQNDLVYNNRSYLAGTFFYYWFLIGKEELINKCVPVTEYTKPGFETNWDNLMNLLRFGEETESEVYAWNALNKMFVRVSNIMEDEEYYLNYHLEFFQECIEDNIFYVELRSGFPEFNSLNNTANTAFKSVLEHESYDWRNHFYYEEINARIGMQDSKFLFLLKTALDSAVEKTGKNLKLKIILNARRDLDPLKVEECQKLIDKINSAIIFKHIPGYDGLVIGFDFVSEEDRGIPTRRYASLIYGSSYRGATGGESSYWADLMRLNNILDIPRIQNIDFYLHDGESFWNGSDNVLDACIASKYRIGHGFNIINYPDALDTLAFVKTRNEYHFTQQPSFPMLELCPVSNQLLRYFTDLRLHPAYSLMKQGVQCVICNDDPQMFGNGGLSYDFWMAYTGFGIDLNTVKRLVYNAHFASLGYSAAGEDINFNNLWNNFVNEALGILPESYTVNTLNNITHNNNLPINFKESDPGNFKRGRSDAIAFIVIHYTGNNGDTARNNAFYFAENKLKNPASAHYFVDENPEAWQSVKDCDTAWHCGDGKIKYNDCRNYNSIGIEMCSRKDALGKFYIKEETVNNAITLTRLLMAKYKIPAKNVIRHFDVTRKQCPLPFVNNESLWESFKAKLIEH